MDHSDTMEALCKAAAPPLQHRQAAAEGQDENSQPKVSHQDSELQKSRKLSWVSVMLFIYYFAQNMDTGCAITSFHEQFHAVHYSWVLSPAPWCCRNVFSHSQIHTCSSGIAG